MSRYDSNPFEEEEVNPLAISKSSIMNNQVLMGCDKPYLPEDMIREILKRLPVRSLIRFQYVSKHWKNLIKSPSPTFIAENLRHQNPSLLLWQRDIFGPLRSQFRRSGPLLLRLIDCEMRIRKVQSPPLLSSLWNVWIVGSCNGLVCVGINESNVSAFVVWNPATRDARRIPRTKSYKLDVWDCSGFGFSTIVNDYKIVQAYDEGAKARISSIEVYSLSTGSWKEIELGPLKDVIPFGESMTFNGHIFWQGINVGGEEEEEEDDDDFLIVSFDIAMEVFTFIPGLRQVGNVQLTVYNDRLALLSMTLQNYLSINLRVFEEGGLGSSTGRWIPIKKYIGFPHLDTFRIPITIWRNNEIVCSTSQADESRIGFFNKEGDMFTIPGNYVNVFNHVQSLVPVGISHLKNLDYKDEQRQVALHNLKFDSIKLPPKEVSFIFFSASAVACRFLHLLIATSSSTSSTMLSAPPLPLQWTATKISAQAPPSSL